MGINLTLRTDIAQDLDFMILDIRRENTTWDPISLINIYNQRTQEPHTEPPHKWMADCLQDQIPNCPIPMVIAGNWNMRDLAWDDGITTPSPYTG